MQVDTSLQNEVEIALEPGETLYFSMRYLRGRDFGVPALPPCPLGSPLARLIHGCYWLGRHRADDVPRRVRLTGPTVVGNFRVVELAEGRSMFINCAHLVAFSFHGHGGLRTRVGQILSPTMWALGHPLPVVATGPGTVVMYGEGLRLAEVGAGTECIPSQVVAFDPTCLFQARALNPDSGSVSHLANAVGRQARWVFREPTTLLLLPINRPEHRASRLVLHLAMHLVFWALLVYLFGV